MKKSGFIFVFISTHVAFVFLQIHQYSNLVNHSYQKQKTEKIKELLMQKKQALTHQLCVLHNKNAVKKFAENTLQMSPVEIKQIKKIGCT